MKVSDLKQIAELLDEKLDERGFVTKNDLKGFATKNDLKGFATKDDLNNFATKDDLKKLATKEDLKALPTRIELKEELHVLQENLEGFIMDVFKSADDNKAEKEDVELLKVKVQNLEEKVFHN